MNNKTYNVMKLKMLGFIWFFCVAFQSNAQISFTNQNTLLQNSDFHSGVAIGVVDMNGDGKDDILRYNQGHILNIEYQNNPNTPFGTYQFGSVNSSSEWSTCVADVDKNGFNDILVGGAYDNIKLIKANATGSDYTSQLLPNSNIFIQGSNFVDIDNDGWADIFACHDDADSRSYRNTLDGNFVLDQGLINTAMASGNSGNYASIWTDYDNDGDLDMYLSKCRGGVNDPTDLRRINRLFQNDGNNNFTDVAQAAGLKFGDQSWSTDFADIDNDGDLDCFIINHYSSSLLMLNNGNGTFTDITSTSGIQNDLDFFGIQAIFRDFDNDGFVDLVMSGTEDRLFKNNGNGTFSNTGFNFTTNDMESFAIGDLNADGYLDIYAGYADLFTSPTTIDDVLWMNDGGANNYFSVLLDGTTSNINGIGARVELHGAWGIQIREVRSGEGYGIMNSFTQHFGIGSTNQINKLVVKWPSGTIDEVLNPTSNQVLNLVEGSSPVMSDITLTCPDDIIIQALPGNPSQTVTWNIASATTTCSTQQLNVSQDAGTPLSGSALAPGVYNIGFTANDNCGNTAACSFTVTVLEYNEPTCDVNLTTASNSITVTGLNSPHVIAKLFSPSWSTIFNCTDNCDDPLTIGGLSEGTYHFSYNLYDANWQEICSDLIDIEVGGNPPTGITLTCPADITLAGISGNPLQTVTWNPPTASTTCATGGLSLTQDVGTPPSGTDLAPGTYVISYTATDNCGNTEVCSFNVVIESWTATSTITCPADITVTATSSDGMIVNYDLPSTSTNCPGGISTPELLIGFGLESGSFFPIGTTDITYTATEGPSVSEGCVAGNIGCVFSVTVLPPNNELCNVNVTATSNSVNVTGLNAPHVIAKLFSPSWSTIFNCFDDCDNPLTIGGLTEGTYHFSYQLYDANWQSICNELVDVEVGGNPPTGITLTCPSDITLVGVPGNPQQTVTWNEPTATTTCTTSDVTLTLAGNSPPSGTSLAPGTYSIDYTATDNCGNTEVCSFSVTVENWTATTTINCPVDITVTAPDENGMIVNYTAPTATSDCPGGVSTPVLDQGLASGSLFPVGTTYVSYSANEGSGPGSGCVTGQVNCNFNVIVLPPNNGTCNVTFTTTSNSITVNGLTAGHVIGKIFSPSWSTLYNCLDDCDNPLVLNDLSPGTYHLSYNLYDSDWSPLCNDLVDVIVGTSAPSIAAQAEFISFDALAKNRKAKLNWVSNTGFKNDYFEVQRSADGSTFESIAEVNDIDEGHAPIYFDYADEQPLKGVNFYRVKQFFVDGTFRYTTMKRLIFELPENNFELFPNPSNGEVYVQLKEFVGKAASIQVVNHLGQTIHVKNIDELPNHAILLALNQQQNGLYTIMVQVENLKPISKKLVLARLY